MEILTMISDVFVCLMFALILWSVGAGLVSKNVQWRWANDKFYALDKLGHILFGAWCAFAYDPLLGASILVIWEIKDAVCPWEIFSYAGGDGFSLRDIVADAIGYLLMIGIVS